MPIYEYKCDNGHVFDVIQKMSDEALTKCQECGAPAVRVLHSPAVHFKGSGFYNTDYGKKKGGGSGNGGSGEGAKESKGSEPSSSSESSSNSSESKGDSKAAASSSSD